ncbi:4-hydroxy-2-oxo-heptane-1,7-dioate aldolase [Rosistilla ulvae]|uniref:4-hydroxy-2-oxo-heptane-1,7-dioate aldolase n=1 Tax=Rosistilla ulvae TaxID=1930277 RepID=A0A517LXF1_9BACT|nr:aldolase/citrate lyase family protein [Rosistilla ulvae]QDS87282.1 4-hydroxy-2-oxo-heptane-1,7-dioate aldolase [Rosistilla ulvae]
MRNSKTLAKVRAGKPVRMCSFGHFIPAYIQMAADSGYDCLWLDAEHRAFTDREIQTLLSYCHRFDIDCMLRPPTLEKSRLYRYLEDGATGLMIPHVSTADRAAELVQSVKFPPLGDRGQDGVGLDAGFLSRGDEYVEHANRETFLVVQIETPQAVGNIDAIAAVPGVDGMFIGPGDLGLRIRRTETNVTIAQANADVAAAAAKHGKFWGGPGLSLENIQHLYQLGAQMIAHGNDYDGLLTMLRNSSAELDAIYG